MPKACLSTKIPTFFLPPFPRFLLPGRGVFYIVNYFDLGLILNKQSFPSISYGRASFQARTCLLWWKWPLIILAVYHSVLINTWWGQVILMMWRMLPLIFPDENLGKKKIFVQLQTSQGCSLMIEEIGKYQRNKLFHLITLLCMLLENHDHMQDGNLNFDL